MTAVFEVIQPGMLTTFQTLGRTGFQRYGLSESGAMDEVSLRWGLRLVNLPMTAVGLEIAFGQVRLKVLKQVQVAVTGADLQFQINGQPAPRYQCITVKPNDLLEWSYPTEGSYAYLVLAGGFKAPAFFGSPAVHLREGWGQPLIKGQQLHEATGLPSVSYTTPLPQSLWQPARKPLILRVIPGGQYEDFSTQERERFFGQTFLLTHELNRTGYQVEGAHKMHPPYVKMVSEGITLGAVQIPPHGNPIIMMREHPTMGGYPKIGTIFSLDLSYLAQAWPNQPLTFRRISQLQAQKLRQRFEALWH